MRVTIGFSRPKKFRLTSFFMRLWQGWVPYSHIYIRFNWRNVGEVVAEASYGRTHLVSYDHWKEINHVHYEKNYEISLSKCEKLQRVIIEHNWKYYGFLTILGIVLKKWFGIKGIGDDDTKTFICSEHVAYIMEQIDEPLVHGVNLDYIEPKELLIAIKEE